VSGCSNRNTKERRATGPGTVPVELSKHGGPKLLDLLQISLTKMIKKDQKNG
jgi:hypothetical protein